MGWAERNRQPHDGQRSGTVTLLAAGQIRYTVAAQCLGALDLPPGSRKDVHAGTLIVPHNRNLIAKDFEGEWLLMVDDDQVYPPDMARRLLRHLANNAVDIVVPLILRRKPPYLPVVFERPDSSDGEPKQITLTKQRGLQPVYAAGTGVVLIRRRVFDRISSPYFDAVVGHDVEFCAKAQRAGCGVYCDFDVRVGHVLPMALWPTWSGGRWAYGMAPLGPGGSSQGINWVTKVALDGERSTDAP